MVRIVTICTGNICRSPYAERFLQARFDEVGPGLFDVSSAGTQALVGRPMDERAAARLAQAGGTHTGFAARQLTGPVLDGVDFVLALTAAHRDAVVAGHPRLLKRTYTVREFARVLQAIATGQPGEVPRGGGAEATGRRWEALRRLAALRRHAVRAAAPDDDDVVDPYRMEDSVFDAMADQLLPALTTIAAFEEWASRPA